MKLFERKTQQTPLLTLEERPTTLQDVAQSQLQVLLQKEPLTHAALVQHLSEKYPPVPSTPNRDKEWHKWVPFASVVVGVREMNDSVRRSVRIVDNIIDRSKDEAIGLLDRGVFDLAQKIVQAAKEEPEGVMAKVTSHFLDTWEEQEKYATELYVYTNYPTRDMTKPEKPSHPLEKLEALAAESVVFRELEDHLGNLIQIHVSKNPTVNKLLEAGIDLGAGKLIDTVRKRATEKLVTYIAVASAKENPEEMQQRLITLAEHAYTTFETSSYSKKQKRRGIVK